jgi:hypothetical protein
MAILCIVVKCCLKYLFYGLSKLIPKVLLRRRVRFRRSIAQS